jgi:hypothetical protein
MKYVQLQMDLNYNCRWPKADVEHPLSLTVYWSIQKIDPTDSSALIPLQQARKIQRVQGRLMKD